MVWPDVQLIVSKDAATTFALTQKQLASVGAPIITGTSLTPSLPKLLWRWNCAITDGGGDEAATRGKIRGIIDNHRPQEGFVDLDCQQHAAGNGQKKVLSVTDTASRDRWRLEFLYFASTARFSNLVIHRFWTIRKTWLRKFPEDRELVDKVFAVLCQKPLITRWDTTHLAEMYIRALPIDRFREVVAAAFKDELEEQEKAAKAKKARKRQTPQHRPHRHIQITSPMTCGWIAWRQPQSDKDAIAEKRFALCMTTITMSSSASPTLLGMVGTIIIVFYNRMLIGSTDRMRRIFQCSQVADALICSMKCQSR